MNKASSIWRINNGRDYRDSLVNIFSLERSSQESRGFSHEMFKKYKDMIITKEDIASTVKVLSSLYEICQSVEDCDNCVLGEEGFEVCPPLIPSFLDNEDYLKAAITKAAEFCNKGGEKI